MPGVEARANRDAATVPHLVGPCRGSLDGVSRGGSESGLPVNAGSIHGSMEGGRQEGGEEQKQGGLRLREGAETRTVRSGWGSVPPVRHRPRQAEQTATGPTRPSRYAVAYGEPGNPGAGPLPRTVGRRRTGGTHGRARLVAADARDQPRNCVDQAR